MAEKYRVAVATSDGVTVDSHFGHVDSFEIFEVDEETGAFDDVGPRSVAAACSGGACGGTVPAAANASDSAGCGGRNGSGGEGSRMDEIAGALSDVDYVLVARIGPHAVRALARRNIAAYDIVLPVGEAVAKINEFRRKIRERKSRSSAQVREG